MNTPRFIVLYNLLFQLLVNEAHEAGIADHPNWKLLNYTRCGNSNAERIVGGENAAMGAYPWIARVGYSRGGALIIPEHFRYLCGATLINDHYVISAAHCVTDLPSDFKVAIIRLGEYDSATNPDCENGYCAPPVQDFRPVSIIIPSEYNRPTYQNDIALIRLDRPVKYNEFVLPICLHREAKSLNKDYVGTTGQVAGWGIVDITTQEQSRILQTVTLPIISLAKCRRLYRRLAEIDFVQLCVGGIIGRDSCAGDSGGPLMKVESVNGPPKYYLIGLVSFGVRRCGESTKPAIYTKLGSYMEWILNSIYP